MNELHITVTVGTILGLVGTAIKVAMAMSKMQTRLDIMWDFTMRRALAEGLNKHVVTQNSPVVVTDEARSWFEGIKSELQQFYLDKGSKLSDADLQVAIEKLFGERLAQEISIPHKLHAGSCLLAAILIAKEAVPPVTEPAKEAEEPKDG